MRVLTSILVLISLAMAWGNQVSLTGGALGYIASDGDTVTIEGTKASFEDWGLVVKASDKCTIFVDLGTDTLEFNIANNDSSSGIIITRSFNPDNFIRVNGGTILHGASDSTVKYNVCLSLMGGYQGLIESVDMYISGEAGRCVDHEQFSSGASHDFYGSNGTLLGEWNGSLKNWHFRSGVWETDVWGYDRRDFNYGSVCRLNQSRQATLNEGEYHYWIDDVNVVNACHSAIDFAGTSRIENCSLEVDARNGLSTPENHSSVLTWANAVGIGCLRPAEGSYIRNNYIWADSNYHGMHGGILIQIAQGTSSNPIDISGNTVIGHAGYDYEYGYLTFYCIRLRWNNDTTNVHDNYFYAFAGDTSLSYMGRLCVGIDWYNQNQLGTAEPDGREPDTSLNIYSNHVEALLVGNNFDSEPQYGHGAFAVRVSTDTMSAYHYLLSDCSFHDNYLKASTSIYYFNSSYGEPHVCHDLVVEGDTIIADTAITGVSFYLAGMYYGDGSAANNIIIKDMINPGGLLENNIYYDPYISSADITFEYTCSLLVLLNDNPAADQPVEFVNAFGDIFYQTTGADGWVTPTLRSFRSFKQISDSLYNDYSINIDDTVIDDFNITYGINDTIALFNSEKSGSDKKISRRTRK